MDLVLVISANNEQAIGAKTYNGEAYHRGHNGIFEFLKARGAEYNSGTIRLYGRVKRKAQRRSASS